jgi:hypothetical protein
MQIFLYQKSVQEFFSYGAHSWEGTRHAFLHMLHHDLEQDLFDLLESIPIFYLRQFPFQEMLCENGDNILHWASRSKSQSRNPLIRFLIDSGVTLTACLERKNTQQKTPIECCLAQENFELHDWFLTRICRRFNAKL